MSIHDCVAKIWCDGSSRRICVTKHNQLQQIVFCETDTQFASKSETDTGFAFKTETDREFTPKSEADTGFALKSDVNNEFDRRIHNLRQNLMQTLNLRSNLR